MGCGQPKMLTTEVKRKHSQVNPNTSNIQEYLRTAGNTESPAISIGLQVQGGGSSGGNSANQIPGGSSPQ